MIRKSIVGLLVLLGVATIGIFAYRAIFPSQLRPTMVSMNGQMGLLVDKKTQSVLYEEETISLYETHSKPITLYFESFNMGSEHDHTLWMGQQHFNLSPTNLTQNLFIPYSIEVLGLNIIDGALSLSIDPGLDSMLSPDTFRLRNFYLSVADEQIWSDQYDEENFFDYDIRFGPEGIKTSYRSNYVQSLELTFSIPAKHLDAKGALLTLDEKEIHLSIDGSSKSFNNPSFLSIETNLSHGIVLTTTTPLEVSVEGHDADVLVMLNGMIIPKDFVFHSHAWSVGEHTLTFLAFNSQGYVLQETRVIELTDMPIKTQKVSFTMYDPGPKADLSYGIDNLGQQVSINPQYQNAFGKIPMVHFKVAMAEETAFVFEGDSLSHRTTFMQVYNHSKQQWDTVSSHVSETEGPLTLGYDVAHKAQDYVLSDFAYVRVASKNLSNEDHITSSLVHFTDTQYISQRGALAASEFFRNEAKDALISMREFLIDAYENSHLVYTVTTGDYIQTMSHAELEWPVIMESLLSPLIDGGYPFGVVSGNHDVGATSDHSIHGGNSLDEELFYNHFYEHLGENVFAGFDYYGGSYLNNRSHYDLLTIEGHPFLFLYIGWGSSIRGLHVADHDIEYAKSVLALYPDHTVVLALHDYLGNSGNRTATGEVIFQYLVKPYANIRFVLSGHINGISKRIDYIDDNNDGIKERSVLQLLTNLQEEENLYGATFMRLIGFDFTYSRLTFNLFSPFFNDYKAVVNTHADYVNEHRQFRYDFDLNQIGYGLITRSFG